VQNTSERSAPVLIVEDEPLLRIYAADIIEQAGFQPVEAEHAEQALEILARRSDIPVVVMDVQMPGALDGLMLAHVIRKRWPPIEMIVMSGAVSPKPHALPLRTPFLPKPFSPEKLTALLQLFLP
jgi:CheY-like chemotaxis protein